jgi:hypothetical protein
MSNFIQLRAKGVKKKFFISSLARYAGELIYKEGVLGKMTCPPKPWRRWKASSGAYSTYVSSADEFWLALSPLEISF